MLSHAIGINRMISLTFTDCNAPLRHSIESALQQVLDVRPSVHTDASQHGQHARLDDDEDASPAGHAHTEDTLLHADTLAHMRACPPGAVLYAQDAGFFLDRTAADEPPVSPPVYQRSFGSTDDACRVCGSYGHWARECPQRSAVRGGAREPSRYHGGESSTACVCPTLGNISDALRAALGLAEGEPPGFLRQMQQLGYPPGYLTPVPDVRTHKHWGYAANGPLSRHVAARDRTYQALCTGAAVPGHAHTAGSPDMAMITDNVLLSGDAVRSTPEWPADIPGRLTPFLPVCTCTRHRTNDAHGWLAARGFYRCPWHGALLTNVADSASGTVTAASEVPVDEDASRSPAHRTLQKFINKWEAREPGMLDPLVESSWFALPAPRMSTSPHGSGSSEGEAGSLACV